MKTAFRRYTQVLSFENEVTLLTFDLVTKWWPNGHSKEEEHYTHRQKVLLAVIIGCSILRQLTGLVVKTRNDPECFLSRCCAEQIKQVTCVCVCVLAVNLMQHKAKNDVKSAAL